MSRKNRLGVTDDPRVAEALTKEQQYELREARRRMKRLLKDAPKPGDFGAFLYELIVHRSGLQSPSFRGRGELDMAFREGQRDVGAGLLSFVQNVDGAAWAEIVQARMAELAQRKTRKRRVEGDDQPDPEEIE